MSTGYAPERAATHDIVVAAVCDELTRRGYPAELLVSDGHRPDIRFTDHQGMRPYIDVKTGGDNIAWEINDYHAWRQIETLERQRVYIVHQATPESPWTVDTPSTLVSRLTGGPRRRSGNGSSDDWYLSLAGGTPFGEYFPLGARLDVTK